MMYKPFDKTQSESSRAEAWWAATKNLFAKRGNTMAETKDANLTQDQNTLEHSEVKADENIGNKAWTDEGQGEGVDYPEGTDGYHSGEEVPDYTGLTTQQVEQMEKQRAIDATHAPIPEHEHNYRPGLLNSQKKVLTCSICGDTKDA